MRKRFHEFLLHGMLSLCSLLAWDCSAADEVDGGQEVILIERLPLVIDPVADGHEQERIHELSSELLTVELQEKLFPEATRNGMEWPLSLAFSGESRRVPTLLLWFYQKAAPHRKRAADVVEQYCRFRIGGVSQAQAIDIAVNGDPDIPGMAEQQKALREGVSTGALTIPLRKLRKIQPRAIPSLWFLGTSDSATDYVFEDETFAFIVRVRATSSAERYVIDAQEMNPKLKPTFAAAAAAALKAGPQNEHKEPKRLVPFWLEMKKRLKAKGIKWRSPFELDGTGRDWF